MPAAWDLVKITTDTPGETGKTETPEKFLAVIVPTTGTVSMDWFTNFRSLKWPKGSRIVTVGGQPVDVARDSATRAVLKEGFQWLFFWDSDVILPVDGVKKLLEANIPLVNGMYVAKRKVGDGFFWDMWCEIIDPAGNRNVSNILSWGDERYVDAADVVGAGCMLVHRSVFEKMDEMYPGLPYFFWSHGRREEFLNMMFVPDPLMRKTSEDFWFCLLAKKCGFKIVVDTSVKCGHISRVELCEKSMEMQTIEIQPGEVKKA